jgi:RsiW-degrading membrane proteinase PrsW (M82 family)
MIDGGKDMISWWWLVLAFVGGVAFGFFLALIITANDPYDGGDEDVR